MNSTRLEKLKEVFKNARDLAGNGQQIDEDVLTKLKNICDELDRKTGEGNVSVNDVPTMAEFLTELKVLETTGSLLGKIVREFQITAGQTFSIEQYAEKLRAKLSIDEEEIDWMLMTPSVVPIINRAPGIHMLVGSFEICESTTTPVKKTPIKKIIKVERGEQEYAEKRAPSKIENMEVDDNSVNFKVDYLMKNLHRCYKENDNNPISFYKFILHPCNFTTTVENIFHISFIIRDSKAHLDIVDDDIVIRPSDESKSVAAGNDQAPMKYQMVFSISMDEWKNLVETHDIQKALIE